MRVAEIEKAVRREARTVLPYQRGAGREECISRLAEMIALAPRRSREHLLRIVDKGAQRAEGDLVAAAHRGAAGRK